MKAISKTSFELLTNLANTSTGSLKASLKTIISDIESSTESVDIRSIFKFEHLSENAKEKALDHFRYINVNYDDWSDYIIERWYEELESKGFIKPDIRYSGFCSQGDGASFTAQYIDLEKYLRSTKQWSKYKVLHTLIKDEELTVKTEIINHRYYHSNTVNIELCNMYCYNTNKQDEAISNLLDDMNVYIRSTADTIYNELYEEYYSNISDEAVADSIISNDFDFDINGNLI